MKRHKKGKHNILTESTSPPPKKKKITKISTNDEMDVDEKECEETTITEDIGQNINEPKKSKINLPGAAEVCIEDVMDISVTDDDKIGDISFGVENMDIDEQINKLEEIVNDGELYWDVKIKNKEKKIIG